jgi:serine/threonine protein kinase
VAEQRALIIGIEKYKDPHLKRRVGTTRALREVSLRLTQGGWETRFLSDESSTLQDRPGLTHILEAISWLKSSETSLLILSGEVLSGRFYPYDARSQFLSQTTLMIKDLIDELPRSSGVILDGLSTPQDLEGVDWSLCAGQQEAEGLNLFSEYGPTCFLHAIVVSLNQCPLDQPLSVRNFFNAVKDNDAPSTSFHNYSSIESVSILTPTSISQIGVESDPELDVSSLSIDEQATYGGRFLERGRYQLLRVLGEGGIGQVYLSQDHHLKIKRAIKVLKIPDQLTEPQQEQIRGRMLQSVRAAQTLSEHSHHVVQVFDFRIDGALELPYIVMEYLDGVTLSRRIYNNPLSLEQVFEVGLTLAETIAIAHEHKVIHRDLKPENIMLIDRKGTPLFVKLLDFDLVKVEFSEVKTQEGQILGTLEYMAPEQLKGMEIDERADVYSLAAILYECFSGARANSGQSQRELIKTLLDTGVTPLEQVAPHLPLPICQLINRSLSLDPTDRPPDGRTFYTALDALKSYKKALSNLLTPMPLAQINSSSSGGRALTPKTYDHLLSDTPDIHSDTLNYRDVSSSPIEEKVTKEEKIKNADAEGLAYVDDPEALADQSTLEERSPKGLTSSTSVKSHVISFIIIGALFGGLLAISSIIKYSKPPPETPQEPSKPLTSLTSQPPPNESPTALPPLNLLPVPSANWGSVQVDVLDGMRRYQGGRLQDQVARFVYEHYFKVIPGDPPHPAWSDLSGLRWRLLKRAPLNQVMRMSNVLIYPQALYELNLTQRPEVTSSALFGEVIVLDQGLLTLDQQGACKNLEPNTLVTAGSWVVPGYRRLNGQCEAKNCLKRALTAYKKAKRQRARSRIRLTFTVERYLAEAEEQHHTTEGRIKCALK